MKLMNKIVLILLLLISKSISFSNEIDLEKLYELPHLDNQLYSKIININDEIYYINENMDFIKYRDNISKNIELKGFKTYLCDGIFDMYHIKNSNNLIIYTGIQGYNNLIVYDLDTEVVDSIKVAIGNIYGRIFEYKNNLFITNNYGNRFSIGKLDIENIKYEYLLTLEKNTIVDNILIDSILYFSLIEIQLINDVIKIYHKYAAFNLNNYNFEIIEESEEKQYYKMINLPNNKYCFLLKEASYNGIKLQFLDEKFELIHENIIEDLVFINDYVLLDEFLFFINYDKKLVKYEFNKNIVTQYNTNVNIYYISHLKDELIFVADDNFVYKLDKNELSLPITQNSSLSIYPNPTKDIIFIKNTKDYIFKLKLYDNNLKFIREVNINSIESKIDISELKEGVYFFIYEIDNNYYMNKIIKSP